ncbi:chemotaxis protein CheW [Methylobacter sp. YRD-M1]|uniref:chemotaxis protein CheW n=1 Tax=Methylobacter sp. YRD-M1 TaxID=2911520 RepID=UPI00227A1AAE|nr:chemotaxis protein CheW [Methylobacter sp. YRD-M1]WAK02463.1 chemotaxis protein CheW [Methylobacter sp. YRD-M1]
MSALLEETEAGLPDLHIGPAVSANGVQGMQRYGFRIGPLGFLFPEHCPGEIVMNPEIRPIPHTRNWMPGVMALRSNLIPVFDLHALLLESPADLNKPMVLVLDQGKQALGFVLQAPPQWLTGLMETPTADVPVPDPIAAQVNKVYLQQETVWLAFDKTDFFTFLAENAKSC